MPNILIVEDDININNLLCEVLRKAGYMCEQAFSGTEAKLLLNIKEKAYTLVLLDLMLPGASGEEVLKEIRKHGRLPVIVLTAKDSIDDKIGVLTDGADDYITKPFEIREVLARIQVQLRHIEVETKGEAEAETKVDIEAETKSEAEAEIESETELKTKAGIQKGQGSGRLEFRDMVLTRSTFEVSIGGRVLPKITKQEFAILELLLKNPKQVFSKEDIFEYAWDEPYMGETKTLDVHISNIRKKIKTVTPDEYIETIWGIGYRLHE